MSGESPPRRCSSRETKDRSKIGKMAFCILIDESIVFDRQVYGLFQTGLWFFKIGCHRRTLAEPPGRIGEVESGNSARE
jgi:hypothetical protein